jgi:hypothetical protein
MGAEGRGYQTCASVQGMVVSASSVMGLSVGGKHGLCRGLGLTIDIPGVLAVYSGGYEAGTGQRTGEALRSQVGQCSWEAGWGAARKHMEVCT